MNKSFLDRRYEKPDYDIVAAITGVTLPDGKTHWNVEVDGAEDDIEAAGILESAAEVLREAAEEKS